MRVIGTKVALEIFPYNMEWCEVTRIVASLIKSWRNGIETHPLFIQHYNDFSTWNVRKD